MSDSYRSLPVNSLPQEARDRIAERTRLLRTVLGSPRQVRESRTIMGLPVHVRESPGGQSSLCTVNTLAMPYSVPTAGGPSMGPGAGAIDYGPGGRMGYDRLRFLEFARQMGVGVPRGIQETAQQFARTPLTERWPGPMASDGGRPSAIGIYDYDPTDDFHRVGAIQNPSSRGVSYGPRPSYFRGETNLPPARRARDDFDDEEDQGVRVRSEDEEEERLRRHTGLACEKAHGVLPHSAWTNLLRRRGS